MKNQRGFSHMLVLVTVVIIGALVAAGFYVNNRNNKTTPPQQLPKNSETISENEAFKLIDECKVNGTYEFHNGEVGLLFKGKDITSKDGSVAVRNVSVKDLQAHQNPACPFTQAAIE